MSSAFSFHTSGSEWAVIALVVGVPTVGLLAFYLARRSRLRQSGRDQGLAADHRGVVEVRSRARWRWTAFGLVLAWMAVEYAWFAGFRAQAWCERVAELVDDYRETNGELPESLDALEHLPAAPTSLLRSIDAPYYRIEGRAFTLGYLVPESRSSSSGTIHELDGVSRAWSSMGYIGPGA